MLTGTPVADALSWDAAAANTAAKRMVSAAYKTNLEAINFSL